LKMPLRDRARKAECLAGKGNTARGSLKEVSLWTTQKTFKNKQILRSANKTSFNLGCSFKDGDRVDSYESVIKLSPLHVFSLPA
jgi:hypothetical protein